MDSSDWAHLPAVAVQVISSHCCPASKARLRGICSTWHDALATGFTTLHVGPGSPVPLGSPLEQQQHEALHRAFPAVTALHLTASSSREYEATYTQDLALLLAAQSQVTALQLQELHELQDFDTLDPASLWDVLSAALPALRGRLGSLAVSGCFWNQPELFGSLRQLTALTELRLANTPLETAHELCVVASMTQLVQLELGIIFDGSSTQHDVPRALESFSSLQRLRVLSVPMWRRSLGGRAHPLAPALSAALQCLTGLTSLAVDGKFSQLRVVANLANLRQLASAAPMSQEGWQAIGHLHQLTLLTSLTPPHEQLQINPARAHPGCDLAALSCKAALRGADVAVLQPGHLATLGQFTALQQLNLRCAATFHQAKQQGQLLTALACLPPSLTQLTLGPLLPLCTQLFTSIARSCPGLRQLHARFTHVAEHCLGQQQPPGMGGTAALQLGPELYQGHQAAAAAGFDYAAHDARMIEQQDEEEEGDAEVLCSISQALSRLLQLVTLELVLAADAAAADGDAAAAAAGAALSPTQRRSSSSYGGSSVLSPRSQPAAATAHEAGRAAAAGGASPGGGGGGGCGAPGMASSSSSARGCVDLQLELLPRSLQRLQLSGPWRLLLSPSAASAAAGDNSNIADDTTPASAQQQQQQQQDASQQCKRCHGRVVSAAAAAPAVPAPDMEAADVLCRCMQGINTLQLDGSNAGSGRPPLRQQQMGSSDTGLLPPLGGASKSSSSSPQGSPAPSAAAAALGMKRPASYGSNIQMSGSSSGMASQLPGSSALSSILSQQQQPAAGDVFMLDKGQGIHKRSRSFSNMLPALPAAETSAAAAGTADDACGGGAVSGSTVLQPEQQSVLPCLTELSLHQCLVRHQALAALVQAAGKQLSKLQLSQLTCPRATTAVGGGGGGHGNIYSYLTTEQLLGLPVCWGCLQVWHIQPYQLWGMLQLGCLDSTAAAVSAAADEAAGRQLPHFSQLISLRRLSVSNTAAAADGTDQQQQLPQHVVPLVALPLHDAAALQRLLLLLHSGLQQLPVLRHLLLHVGPVTTQFPQLPDVSDDVWGPAGEQLLDALPSVCVRHCSPRIEAPHPPVLIVAAPVVDAAAAATGPFASYPDPEYMI